MFNLNILYVEDDIDTREVFSALLDEYCNKLYVVKDGLEGLSVYKKHPIDIILTDIAMPRMDGLKMAEAILSIDEHAYIIILSAYNNSDYLVKAIDIGIHNYLLKPINIDKLENVLSKIAKQIELSKQLEHHKKELEELNQTLHQKVRDEIKKNDKKDMMLLSQSKTSQMGELLSMIAHQWRQPLNALSASSISLNLKHRLGKDVGEEIIRHTKFVETQVQSMSKIITDFMEFFKPENEKKSFSINELLNSIKYIVDAQLRSKGISLEVVGENIEIFSYEKELSNVILNFISNSVDAFDDVSINEKKVTIIVVDDGDDFVEILYRDNAGGIKEENIDKIFDAYFTTKEQGKGTGIGLYMTRRIVHEVLGGDIYVSNLNNGVEFKILGLIKNMNIETV